MSGEKGRFSCYMDLTKKRSAQAYFFLKGLGNLRQDIIIDMVLRTLGDDISMDFEHMSRAEILAVYNENVYVKGRKPQENQKLPDSIENGSVPTQEVKPEQKKEESMDLPEKPVIEPPTVKPPESKERNHDQTQDNSSFFGIEDEKPFPIEDTPSHTAAGIRQVSSKGMTLPLQETSFSDESSEQDDSDDLDDLPAQASYVSLLSKIHYDASFKAFCTAAMIPFEL